MATVPVRNRCPVFQIDTALPGSNPGGFRVIQRGDGIGVLGKNLSNYRYRERLEMDSVVGNISGEKEAE